MGESRWTFTLGTQRNVVGGGYFRVARLYSGDRLAAEKVYDGTIFARRADRKAVKQIRLWRDLYDAKPRATTPTPSRGDETTPGVGRGGEG